MNELPITIGNEADITATESVQDVLHNIRFLFQKVADFDWSLTRAVISSSLKPITARANVRPARSESSASTRK